MPPAAATASRAACRACSGPRSILHTAACRPRSADTKQGRNADATTRPADGDAAGRPGDRGAEASPLNPAQTIVAPPDAHLDPEQGLSGAQRRHVPARRLHHGAGLYFTLVRWWPGYMSAPHTYTTDRLCVVVSGTWWCNSGADFRPCRLRCRCRPAASSGGSPARRTTTASSAAIPSRRSSPSAGSGRSTTSCVDPAGAWLAGGVVRQRQGGLGCGATGRCLTRSWPAWQRRPQPRNGLRRCGLGSVRLPPGARLLAVAATEPRGRGGLLRQKAALLGDNAG